MEGIDRYVEVHGPTPSITVYDSDYVTEISDANAQVAKSGAITEFRVSLAALGITNAATCKTDFPMGIYLDNQLEDPDDNTPDTGTATANCGAPTAITLSSLEAKADAQNNTAALILAASAVATLGLAGVVMVRRRRTA